MKKYFNKCAVVLVTTGREKGEVFIIYKLDDNYAYLINGESRKIENPKKKNLKHLHLLCKSELTGLDINNLNDALTMKFINEYNKSRR